MKEYYELNKTAQKAKTRKYYHDGHQRKYNIVTKKYHDNLRTYALNQLSVDNNLKCIRCGFSDRRALQIDHVNGGGLKEFRKLGVFRILKQIIAMPKEEAISRYQILCANCNWIKKSENGEHTHGKHSTWK
mgnify:CR=1 FL=1